MVIGTPCVLSLMSHHCTSTRWVVKTSHDAIRDTPWFRPTAGVLSIRIPPTVRLTDHSLRLLAWPGTLRHGIVRLQLCSRPHDARGLLAWYRIDTHSPLAESHMSQLSPLSRNRLPQLRIGGSVQYLVRAMNKGARHVPPQRRSGFGL